MKINRLKLILIFASVGFFSSCQKVIELDLNTSSPQIVIQGSVTDQAGPYKVKISKTVNFDAVNTFPKVTNAKVTISDNVGNSEQLIQLTDSTYATTLLQGTPDRTYTLTVEIDGTTYLAKSTMPNPVKIDSIYFEKSRFGNSNQTTIKFHDPANIENYYRLVQLINNKQRVGFQVITDELFQGQTMSYSFMSFRNSQDESNVLKTGDKETIQLECIDNGAYEYFRTAGRGGAQSASPANPVSNISNGALGYFDAYSVSEKVLVVP